MPTINGTPGDDDLVGTAGADIFNGLDGNDRFAAGDGSDQLVGGHGNDVLLGEGGDDFITENDGGSGNDILDGGAGNDSLFLYRLDWNLNETPTLIGGEGNDDITSWSYASGSVVVDAGSGDDVVTLFTSNNSHTIALGAGGDTLNLSPYQPLQGIGLTSRTVSDFQTGAAGDTVLLYNLLSGYGAWDGQSNPFETGVIRLVRRGADTVLQMSGVAGSQDFIDLVVFQNVGAQSFVADNFGGFSPNGVPAAPMELLGDGSFNTLIGGYGNDIIDGAANSDFLDGLAGNDLLRGGDGNDTIRGGYGNDIAEGGAGDDFFDNQHDGGSDTIDAGTGHDTAIVYRNYRDVVEQVSVVMGDGNDQLRYQNFDHGTLTVDFGAGADRFTLLGARQDMTLTLGANNDVVDFSQNYTFNSLLGEMLVTITDYVPGEDRLLWGSYLQNELVGWSGQINPFLTGYLQLEQQGGQVVLFIDRDRTRTDSSALPFLVLENVTLHSLSAVDFAGFDPFAIRDVQDDFNGDGRSDVLWRNEGGLVTNWLGQPSGGFAANNANAATGVPLDWTVVGTGDFNDDGRDDVLWRNDNGLVTNWLGQANGGFVANHAVALTGVPLDWSVAGIGDFNGDGRDDVLWRNDAGVVSDWLGQLNGGFVANHANAATGVPLDWSIVGTGDFNGDGRDDVLWRNAEGVVTNWLGQANGGFAGNHANAATGVPLNWSVVGTGDFNGDGRDDILWRNESGVVTNWLGEANGGFSANHANAATGVPLSWQVAGVGDYNGDGRDDVLWRNDAGVVTNWLGQVNGGFAGNHGNAAVEVPAEWHVQAGDLWL